MGAPSGSQYLKKMRNNRLDQWQKNVILNVGPPNSNFVVFYLFLLSKVAATKHHGAGPICAQALVDPQCFGFP